MPVVLGGHECYFVGAIVPRTDLSALRFFALEKAQRSPAHVNGTAGIELDRVGRATYAPAPSPNLHEFRTWVLDTVMNGDSPVTFVDLRKMGWFAD